MMTTVVLTAMVSVVVLAVADVLWANRVELHRGSVLIVLDLLYAIDCLCGRRDDAGRDRLVAKLERAWRIQDCRRRPRGW